MRSEGGILNTIAGTIAGIGSGFLLIFLGTIVLISNEGNYKMTQDAIKEAGSVVVAADDVNRIDAELEGKLIYGVSKTQTDEIVTDDLFDVAVNAVKLVRKVQYYQLVEEKHTESWTDSDGEEHTRTTYTYEKKWTDEPISSKNFDNSKYRSSNHVLSEIENIEKYADLVNWGAYKLPEFLKTVADGIVPVEMKLSEATKEKWDQLLDLAAAKYTKQAIIREKSEYIHVIRTNTAHLGADPASPAIGDVRVEINYVPPGRDMSIIAQVQGDTFAKYIANNGKEFFSANNKVVGLEQMLKDERDSNTSTAWALRIMGILLVILSIRLIFKPVTFLFSKIPYLGGVVNGGIAFICTMLGLAWSFVVISLAWLFFRPVIGLAILAAAIAIIWLMKKKGDRIDLR